jgi:pyruvate dehydrogenase E2 component (dihydrolipoamide acetyltransferase)
LLKHPQVNASWDGEQIQGNPDINVGLAIAVEDGLVVPVVHQADRLGLQDIARQRSRLVSAVQAGKSTLADLEGGTFTISKLGTHGVDEFSAIVNPPQAAILAVGRIAERVVPVDGQPTVQPMINLTLSCDHRVVDGARGALFLGTLAQLIENPLAMLD